MSEPPFKWSSALRRRLHGFFYEPAQQTYDDEYRSAQRNDGQPNNDITVFHDNPQPLPKTTTTEGRLFPDAKQGNRPVAGFVSGCDVDHCLSGACALFQDSHSR